MNLGQQQLPVLIRNIVHSSLKRQQIPFRSFGANHSVTKWNLEKKSLFPRSSYSSTSSSTLSQLSNDGHYIHRSYSSSHGADMTDAEVKRGVDNVSEKFSEAMELMNDARSSFGTVYFSEDVLDTQAQVKETMDDYTSLLSRLNEKQRKSVIQSIGLKMEELKAQLSMLDDLAKE